MYLCLSVVIDIAVSQEVEEPVTYTASGCHNIYHALAYNASKMNE